MQPTMQPIAQSLANQGRYGDSMLVHMSPREVGGLQSLARLNGKTMTVNPQTGMPEAFSLESFIPAIAGAALTPVLGPAAPFVVGGLYGLTSGSLEKGLLAGLGAYGGAQMAGSFANLAAPAADVTAAAASSGADFAAQQAAAQAAAQQAAVQQATAMNLGGAPTDVFGNVLGIDEMAVAGGQGVSAGLPANASTLTKPPVSGISKLFQPDRQTTYENIGAGMKKAFSSGESALNFLGDNKMNIASSLAPSLITEDPAEVERKKAQIRPYEYQVENLSGAPIDLAGRETERYRGRFIEQDPYYVAKGGLLSLAKGGEASSTSGKTSDGLIYATPAEARVYGQIAAVQRAAGIPELDLGEIVITEPDRQSPYTYRPTPSTKEKDYGIYRPQEEDSPSYRELQEKDKEKFKRGGGVGKGNVRKPISRFDPYYQFGLDMSKIAEEQFSDGGMAGYVYDPVSNSYKMMAKGGLTSLKVGGLREGAFIVPADVISHLGNGSSEAGMKIVQERLKGRPIKGPGDGMSDSIPTTIAGKKPARVANEEAEIPPEVVAAIGDGSMEKGAKKLYEMMDKIRQDRTGKKKQAPAVKADKYMPA